MVSRTCSTGSPAAFSFTEFCSAWENCCCKTPGRAWDSWLAVLPQALSSTGIFQGEVGVRSLIKAMPIKLLACAATLTAGGPVDFGLAELHSALAGRNLKWKVKTELSLDPPENFRIEPYTAGGAQISGGDLRGLMYG